MSKKSLSLTSLRIHSFVTVINHNQARVATGGYSAISCTIQITDPMICPRLQFLETSHCA